MTQMRTSFCRDNLETNGRFEIVSDWCMNTARAVGHSIFTETYTLEELRQNVREAVECHFELGQTPRLIHLHIVRDEVLTV